MTKEVGESNMEMEFCSLEEWRVVAPKIQDITPTALQQSLKYSIFQVWIQN